MTTFVDLDSPKNAGILNYLRSGAAHSYSELRNTVSASPDTAVSPYYRLGTHPDLVYRLWDEVSAKLPAKCNWVVWGRPVLAHPETGIIFGFAQGTDLYALRLPPQEHSKAIAAGAMTVYRFSNGTMLDLATIGPEWVLGNWIASETDWCLAAYEFAGSIMQTTID